MGQKLSVIGTGVITRVNSLISQDSQETTDVLINPLEMHNILSLIFEFLPLEELCSARLVSRQWNREACIHIRRLHGSIRLNKKRNVRKFYDLIQNQNPAELPFGDITLTSLSLKTARILRKLAPYLIRLNIISVSMSWKHLSEVLASAQCLETLGLHSVSVGISFQEEELPDMFSNIYRLVKLKDLHVMKSDFIRFQDQQQQQHIPARLVLELLKLSQKLTYICLAVPSPELNFTAALESMKFLPQMHLQRFRTFQNLTEKDIQILHNCGFKFKHLHLASIRLDSLNGIAILEQFLAAQSNSLRSLHLRYVLLPEDKYPSQHRNSLPTITFPVMNELFRLSIDDKTVEESTILRFSPIFSISTTFPSLKIICLMQASFVELFQNSIPADEIQSKRLELELELDLDELGSLHFQLVESTFPYLQFLHLALCDADSLKLVFTLLPNLVGLTISFSRFNCLDSVMTGFDEDVCHALQEETNWDETRIQDLMATKDPNAASIRNLTNLKNFEMDSCGCSEYGPLGVKKDRCLSDISGYLSFLQMSPLDNLVIFESSMFSLRCEEKLKEYHKNVEIETVNDFSNIFDC